MQRILAQAMGWWVLLAMALVLLCCESPRQILPAQEKCPTGDLEHPRWRELQQLAEQSGALACLQVVWGQGTPGPEGVSQLIKMKGKALYAQGASGLWDQQIQFELPRAADGQKLRFRVFFFAAHVSESTARPICQDQMKEARYACDLDSDSSCQAYLEFRPWSESYQTFEIATHPNSLCQIYLPPQGSKEPGEGQREPQPEPSSGEPSPEADGGPDEPGANPEVQPEPPKEATPEQGCTHGETRACYTGAPKTRKVGLCKDGVQTCDANGAWGPCTGDVLPALEMCNQKDDDCNGNIDDTCVFLARGGIYPRKGKDLALGAAIAANGDVLVTGQVTGAYSFGAIKNTSDQNGYKAIVARISKDGTWKAAQRIKALDIKEHDVGLAIAEDWKGKIWLGGYFGSPLQLLGAVLKPTQDKSGKSSSDGLLATLSPQLQWEYGLSISNPGRAAVTDIAIDRVSKRVFVAGFLSVHSSETPVDRGFVFGAKKVSLGSGSAAAHFLAEASATSAGLQWKWAQVAAQWGSGAASHPSIALDSTGHVYLAGVAGVNLKRMEIGAKTFALSGRQNLYVSKWRLSSNGATLAWGQTSKSADVGFSHLKIALAPRPSGPQKILLAGSAKNGSALSDALSLRTDKADAFLAQIVDQSTQGAWDWAVTSNSKGNDFATAIAVNSAGEIFMAGYSQSPDAITWDGGLKLHGPDTCLVNERCTYVAKASSTGKWLWVVGGGRDIPHFLNGLNSLLTSGPDLFAVGTISGSSFANQPLTNPGYGAVFVGKNVHRLFGLK